MRRVGVVLRARWAAVICDIAANWSAAWPRLLPWPFFVDGVFVFATAMPLLRTMPRRPERPQETYAL